MHLYIPTWSLETVQDFLIKLDIKPPMYLMEISTFSINNVIVRLTKIMNKADKNCAQFLKIKYLIGTLQSLTGKVQVFYREFPV